MPIDASIPLGVRPIQIESPVNQLAKVLQVQGLQRENQLGQLKMDEYQRGVEQQNRLRQLLSTGADAEGLRRGGFLKESMDLEKNTSEVAHKKSETAKNSAETALKKVGLYRDAINGVNDPASAAAYIQAMHADPDLKGSAITAVPVEQLVAQVPQDPAQFAEFKQKFALGAEKYIADQRQRQQIAETGRHNLAAEANTIRGQDRIAADNAASRAQAERHFQAGEAAPQYIQTDAGLVAVPKKPVQGAAPTGTLVIGPDGQPLTRPLKDIPPAQNTAIIENAKALQNIDSAIAAIRANPKALGAKNYLPEGVTQRIDPAGVDARAQIANIAGQRFHDLSGAAVSVGEAGRLKPFIPSDKDTPETAIRKLENLRREYEGVNSMLSTTYSKDQGYRPSPVKPSAAAPSGFRVLGVEK